MSRVAIIGAGMAGTVLAMYLTRRGVSVTIFERGDDPRDVAPTSGRSINLTLTKRGLDSLADVGALWAVMAASVPVSHRLVHAEDGNALRTAYGKPTDFLYSINRMTLNRILLDHLQNHFHIKPLFNHRIIDLDVESGLVTVKPQDRDAFSTAFDTVIGADGAFSAVRQLMQKSMGFATSEVFSSHANIELGIPASSGWTGAKDVLHVWPRHDFMLIAFPNQDGSFTCTFQAPTTGPFALGELKKTGGTELFARLFPDIQPFLMDSERHLAERTASQMVLIKSDVWHAGAKVCLIGDAAHAVYPSMGQGANAAFEDCRILDRLIQEHGLDWGTVFSKFASQRKPATDALSDLSSRHFEDLRQTVGKPIDPRRAALRCTMWRLLPEIGPSLYNNIAFTHHPYDVLIRTEQAIDHLLDELCRTWMDGVHLDVLHERLVGALHA